ncbi:MFS transporter [Novosphingobium sp. 11B]|jgi:MFS family permease|uniref:MFS transporter n=1 Tax=Novosphingobium resinovorum TaxID=158500 RepID=A0A031JZ54_9SPHN|nr:MULTISPECIES: MFS transporter [Sphingomonadaceae]AOR77567.1 MFS transporter [Novosphingobium resinovorum]EJU11447.1 major facilitator superfamily protein [Sphingomonas sp. LH128]EZP82209.1 Major facilitator superfamily protein [Novosphingobium resinovorum]
MNVYRQNARVLTASLVGTAVEFYDFYIYATAAALVFGPLFFPAESATVQHLAAYASFAIAFIARPVGATLFGHFGDRVGRKSTLVASLLLMGGATVLIGVLPTYESAGWIAPALLCLMRFCQGLGLGGEWGGAALLAVESAPKGYEARFGMFPQLGAPVGFFAANGLFLVISSVLSDAEFAAWGWRIPFLLSAVLVGLGLWIRFRLSESPVFAKEDDHHRAIPVVELFRTHMRETVAGTFAVIACFALYYLATTFALGYGTATLGFGRQQFLGVQLFAILFMAVGIVVAGYAADRRSSRSVLMFGCFCAVLLGTVMGLMFSTGSLFVIGVFLCVALFTMGLVYGPIAELLPRLFKARVRYTGASIAFNVGGIVGGGFAPAVAQGLADSGGVLFVGLYISGAALLSLFGLMAVRAERV